MVVLARIQGHPARSHLHARLAKALSPLPVELRLDDGGVPDPWRGYRGCLRDLPRSASHVLIVQDDALPCKNFAQALEQIAASNPDVPVCLFLGGAPASTAVKAYRAMGRKSYVPLGPTPFVPLVAVLWPRRKAQEFLLWSKTGKNMTRADDGNAAKWMRTTRQHILVSVPSLVQHDDSQPSVKGGREHKPWAESWRKAILLAEDALDYEW